MLRSTTCEVYAFVEATAISGPARVYIEQSASLVIELPITFDIASVFAPFDFASFNAAIVSAVSPDWLIYIASVLSFTIGSLYLNSEAISTSTGILQSLSNIVFATNPACIAVPHATIYILFKLFKYSFVKFKSSISICPLSSFAPIVSLIAFGCSFISFSIKSS